MSAAVMMQRIAKVSPRFRARMAAVLYLFSVLTATFTELFLRGKLNVAGGLVAVSSMAAVTLILYAIFRPVNRRLALLAAFFNFEAEGEAAERMQQIARAARAHTESNLYAISPEKSHVSKEFAAGDPEFWTPKPPAPTRVAAKKSGKNEPTK